MSPTGRRPAPEPAPERGQGLVEYSLILGLSAAVAMVLLVFLAGPLADVIDFLTRSIDPGT